jgi:hypothetical protein
MNPIPQTIHQTHGVVLDRVDKKELVLLLHEIFHAANGWFDINAGYMNDYEDPSKGYHGFGLTSEEATKDPHIPGVRANPDTYAGFLQKYYVNDVIGPNGRRIV